MPAATSPDQSIAKIYHDGRALAPIHDKEAPFHHSFSMCPASSPS
jgi:hypothetical protein